MRSGKDGDKTMDPLFPRLHIGDAEKGGPKPPPRNKMALCDQYNVHTDTPRFNSGSTPSRPTKSLGSFGPQVSSSNASGSQQKILPTFCSVAPRSSHLTEKYHSYFPTGINLNAPSTNSETRTSEPMDYPKGRRDENDFRKSCFARVSLVGDKISAHKAWMNPLAGNEMSALKSVNHQQKSSFTDERIRSFGHYAESDVMSEVPDRIMRKRCASVMDSLLRCGDKNELTNVENAHECSEETNVGEKKQKTSDTSVDDSATGLDLSADDVVGVIGEKSFWKVRNIIMQQQRTFAVQIFELHRLIKVQKLIAKSPEVLQENKFNLNEPSIKFPPIDKLLYVTPLDPSPAVTKQKPEAIKPNPGTDHEPDAANDEQGYPRPLPKPVPTPNAKPPPWCFNQWLIPVKSPSEGLIYKPYTGPCPPAVGIMAPVFGNCSPISLSAVGGTAYGIPSTKSYFQPYPMPLINSNPLNLELDHTMPITGVHEQAAPDKLLALKCRESSNALSQQDSSGSSPAEQLQGDELSLFPTTPSFHIPKEQCNEQKVQAIKVVPHNRKSAPESAARIFRSIQEERNRT